MFLEGDEGNILYIIVSGSVRIELSRLMRDPNTGGTVERSVPIASRRAGEHFGEMALLDRKPRMANAITMEPTEILELRRDDFERAAESAPQIYRSILTALTDRLRESADFMKSTRLLDMLGRVAHFFLEMSREHAIESVDGKKITIPLTHKSIADQLGVARESVQRAISELEMAGAIRRNGKYYVILNEKMLQRSVTI